MPALAPFVDATWLAEHRAEVVLADVRWYLDGRSGAAEFEAGHLPGAVFVALERWLAPPAACPCTLQRGPAAPPEPARGRHPLPEPKVFAEGMSRAGIGDASTVVA